MCYKIVGSAYFEYFSFLIIIFNCFTISKLDSKSEKNLSLKSIKILQSLEKFFLYYYITEFFLKIFGLGLILEKGSYFRDPWNLFDFLIVISTIITDFLILDLNYNFTFLKAFRVLRFLRAISMIENLRLVISSLFSAITMLLDSFFVLVFFLLIYSIASLMLFQGLLKKQCFLKSLGIPLVPDQNSLSNERSFCGNIQCPKFFLCGKIIENPNFGLTNFDTIFYSFITVFRIITLDDWSSIVYMIQKSFTNYISIFFLALVIIGGYFILNINLVVIKVNFSESHGLLKKGKLFLKENPKVYNLKILRKLSIFSKNNRRNCDSRFIKYYPLDKINESNINDSISIDGKIEKKNIKNSVFNNINQWIKNKISFNKEINHEPKINNLASSINLYKKKYSNISHVNKKNFCLNNYIIFTKFKYFFFFIITKKKYFKKWNEYYLNKF